MSMFSSTLLVLVASLSLTNIARAAPQIVTETSVAVVPVPTTVFIDSTAIVSQVTTVPGEAPPPSPETTLVPSDSLSSAPTALPGDSSYSSWESTLPVPATTLVPFPSSELSSMAATDTNLVSALSQTATSATSSRIQQSSSPSVSASDSDSDSDSDAAVGWRAGRGAMTIVLGVALYALL